MRRGSGLIRKRDLRREWALPEAGEEPVQLRRILRRDRTDPHAQTFSGVGVAHYRFGADLSFLNEKVQAQQFALALPRAGLEEETEGAEIADAGNIAVGGRFPVNPHILCKGNARHSSAGGAACDCQRTHHLHPGTAKATLFWPDYVPSSTGREFSQRSVREVNKKLGVDEKNSPARPDFRTGIRRWPFSGILCV